MSTVYYVIYVLYNRIYYASCNMHDCGLDVLKLINT